MMEPKTISSPDTYLNQPCNRCGAKRKVARKWKEDVPTFTGTTTVSYTKVICTDPSCQETFEEALAEEIKKKEALKSKREEQQKKRTPTKKN